jgi:peptidyl-prolyl cis-trans isomerase A (cyclophilin A)
VKKVYIPMALCLTALLAAALLHIAEPPRLSADRIGKSEKMAEKLAQVTEAEKAPPAEIKAEKPEPATPEEKPVNAETETEWPEEAPDVYHVLMKTSKGDVVIEVQKDWAPKGAQRFYTLVREDFYDGNRFFRVVPGFVVQFGISGIPIANRKWRTANLKDDPVMKSNTEGYVSFASAGPNSRTTQVFINLGDNRRLDHYGAGFPPFGKVVKGMDVVKKFNAQYGDSPTSKQAEINTFGNEWLEENFPGLDYIKKAELIKPEGVEALQQTGG